MTPATPGPLTILLLSDDPALLADEAGGRVPTMGDLYGDGRWEIVTNAHVRYDVRALVLVLGGAVVNMGWDRFRRLWRGGGAAPFANPVVYEVIAYAQAFARDTGARVVLLRDGREVQS